MKIFESLHNFAQFYFSIYSPSVLIGIAIAVAYLGGGLTVLYLSRVITDWLDAVDEE